MSTQIVARRYNLDSTNSLVFLGMFSIGRGFVGRVVIDLYERTPFHFPEECPARALDVIEAIERYLTIDGVKISVKNDGQILTINGSEISGVAKEKVPEDEKDYEWDSYGETFEDYVYRIVGEDNYRMEVYEDIIPPGAGDEYRRT